MGHRELATLPNDMEFHELGEYGTYDACGTLLLGHKLQNMAGGVYDRLMYLDTTTAWTLACAEVRGTKIDPDTVLLHKEEQLEEGKKLDQFFGSTNLEPTSNIKMLSYFKMADMTYVETGKPYKIRDVTYDTLRDMIDYVEVGQVRTSKETIEIAENLIAHRRNRKLLSTYLGPLERAFLTNYVIHPDFHIAGPVTGRLSCSNPNLQNIPRDAKKGGRLRTCFVARDGYKLAEVDYSQVELRVAAWLSGDGNMMEDLIADIHDAVRAYFGLPPGSDERRVAKTINFGIIYGMGVTALVSRTNRACREAARDYLVKTGEKKEPLQLTEDQGKDYIVRYFDRYFRLQSYMRERYAEAAEKEKVVAPHGRVRRLLGAGEKTQRGYYTRLAQKLQRMGGNHPIQSLAAEITKLSMCLLHAYFVKNNIDAHILLNHHDSVMFEYACADEIIAEAVNKFFGNRAFIKKYLGVDIEAPTLEFDMKVGTRWGEMETLKLN